MHLNTCSMTFEQFNSFDFTTSTRLWVINSKVASLLTVNVQSFCFVVLGWQNTCESVEDIKATLAALSTEIDLSVLYRGLDPNNTRRLVSVVCYYGQHYHCFAYNHVHQRWMMYDDKTVKVVGRWEDVVSMCEKGHLQPQVLFYEAVN
ncbi:putative ubiquitinyl hydrolase 1 [Helianthus annuus]|nr:putative ubiquitinyl hydrolase 1 [Helianthus annuus]